MRLRCQCTLKLSSVRRSTHWSSIPDVMSIAIPCFRISSSIKQTKQIHAQMITNRTPNSNINLGILIKLYTSHGNHKDPIKLFARAECREKYTYMYTFRACTKLQAFHEGIQAHSQFLKSGFVSDAAIQTTAINFYANCKYVSSARKLFDEMQVRTSVSWNAMMNCYSINGSAKETFVLLREMLTQCIKPTGRTPVQLLTACSQLKDLKLGRVVHGFTYKFSSASQNCYIGTNIVDMYSKCGSLANASKMFDEMMEKNVLTWTTMMSGLAMHGRGDEAIEMMNDMQRHGILPNEVTFTSLLSACAHARLLQEGVQIFRSMKGRFGIEPNIWHYGCIVGLLGRAGLVEEAGDIVKRMPIEPDLVVWRELLNACRVHGRVDVGEEVGRKLLEFETSSKKGNGDERCEDFVALSNVYASAGRWYDVEIIRDAMRCMKVSKNGGQSSFQII